MSDDARERGPRVTAVLRGETETVMPLELFFDLVFVLAITQCTALMAHEPTWRGLGKGLLVLGILWWSWVGYAWLTSVVDPEEGVVRIVLFAAMAALLVVALCVPHAFGDDALLFALAYAFVRAAHIALFALASRYDATLRRSVTALAGSSAVGVAALVVGGALGGVPQAVLWTAALLFDMAGPYFFGADGWKLVPGHFAERHGLIVLIALGESIVAIGAGADVAIDAEVVVGAVLGMTIAAALWWVYFDVTALVAARRLENATAGRERNEVARDAFSYLHFPMVAGIVLVALGLKKALGHVTDDLATVPAVALLGGTALYLLAHVAFRLRNVRRFSRERTVAAAVCLALVPVATSVSALVLVSALAAVLVVLIAIERRRFVELRGRVRAHRGG